MNSVILPYNDHSCEWQQDKIYTLLEQLSFKLGKTGIPQYGEVNSQIIDWIALNVVGEHLIIKQTEGLEFWFEDSRSAVLFKLTWT